MFLERITGRPCQTVSITVSKLKDWEASEGRILKERMK